MILPFTVLRQLDCVLEPSKAAVLEEKTLREGQGLDPVPFLLRKAGQNFCNTSPLDMKRLMGDQDNIGENLRSYIQAFTPKVRDIFESFAFHLQVDRLEKIDRCAAAGISFAFETTLAGKGDAHQIQQWQTLVYSVKLVFLQLQSVNQAIARAGLRVRQGGHAIPPEVIARRFKAGLRNFETLYRPPVSQ